MSTSRHRILSVLLASAALAGAANLGAYAANGSPLLAGNTNRESKATAIVNTGQGPALRLKSKPNVPSLSVSSAARVPKLNADRVDGLEGAALQNQLTHFVVQRMAAASTSSDVAFRIRPGRYLMSYALVMDGNPFACFTTASPNTALSFATPGGFGAETATASTLVTVPSSGVLSLTCNAASGATFNFISSETDALSTVDFLRLDQVVTGPTPGAVLRRTAPGRTATPSR